MASVETLLLVLLYVFYAERETKTKVKARADHIIEMNEQMILSKSGQEPESVSSQFKRLFKNRDFVLAMLSSSIMVSLTYSFPALLEQLILPWGFVSNDASIFGAGYNAIGILGGIAATLILNKKQVFSLL